MIATLPSRSLVIPTSSACQPRTSEGETSAALKTHRSRDDEGPTPSSAAGREPRSPVADGAGTLWEAITRPDSRPQEQTADVRRFRGVRRRRDWHDDPRTAWWRRPTTASPSRDPGDAPDVAYGRPLAGRRAHHRRNRSAGLRQQWQARQHG